MTPDKLTVMLELLKEAWVYVHLDPRRDGVLLPDFLREQPRVVLQYGYNMPVPIYDLAVDERGISATLSFRRVSHATLIPWSAVFAMTDGEQRGFIWQEDIPTDLETEAAEPPPAAPPSPSAGRSMLKSVPKPVDAPSSTTPRPGAGAGPSAGQGQGQGPGPGPGPGKKPRPSHLKLVD
jgi:hypothetical protein